MQKKKGKQTPPVASPLFVYGLNENGKPRGARFPVINDDIVNAAMNMKCHLVTQAPKELADLGLKLPLGRIYASGKAFIPNIRRDLYEKLAAAHNKLNRDADAATKKDVVDSKRETQKMVAQADVALGKKVKGALPLNWDGINVGDMVLAQTSPEDGWWEAIVTERDTALLTLRYRDYPKEPTVVRHISAIARIYSGPS